MGRKRSPKEWRAIFAKKQNPTLVKNTKFLEGEVKILPIPSVGIKTGYKSEKFSMEPKSLLAKKLKTFKIR